MSKRPKPSNADLIDILEKGPDFWGCTPDQHAAKELATEILLEARQPLEDRRQILDALIEFNIIEGKNIEGQNAMGDDL